MRIQHNIMAMNAYRNYNTNTSAVSKNLEKLSSGYKINRAGDDAAGLAISEKMRAQITGLNAAQKNVKDGISLVKTAEGAMQEIQDMLNRMDYLATQSANGTYDNEVDRANLQKEVASLKDEINRIADSANFNGIKLLDGSQGSNNIGAVGSMDLNGMIDGTAATPAGKAEVTVTLDSAKVISTQVDATGEKEGVDPSVATGDKYTIKIADTTGANQTTFTGKEDTPVSKALDGNTSLSDIADLEFVNKGATYKDMFDVTVTKADGTKITGWTDTTKLETGWTIELTAKNKGLTGNTGTNTEIGVTNPDGTIGFVAGQNEGAGASGSEANYEIKLDLTKLEGGQVLELNGKTITFSAKDASDTDTTAAKVSIKNLDRNDATDQATIAEDIVDALKAQHGVFASGTGASATFTVDANGVATIKMVAANGTGAAGNLGEVRFVSNSGTNPMVGDDGKTTYTYNKYQAADADAAGRYAEVTYKNDALKAANLTKGSKLKIGDVEIEVVDGSATDVKDNQIKATDVTSKLAEVIEKQGGTDFGRVVYNGTTGELKIIAKEPGDNKLADLKASTKITVEKPDSSATTGNVTGGTGSQAITPGTTTLADLKKKDVGGTKLGDIFDIKIEGKTDTDKIELGDKITYTAKQTGKLDKKFMDAITYSTGASSEVREGWDEGTDGAGNNTHYELNINTGKLAGGNSFSFGTGDKTSTFDITYDDVDTDNGTVTTPAQGTEVGKDRTKINLSTKMSDQEIADAIKTAVGGKMTDFNVKVEVSGSNIKLSLDAKKGTDATNLGGVRYSSVSGAFSGGVYKAYNAFDGGTPGTYAKVSYDFDITKLESGDSLTIGGTTIKVGDKTATTKNVDGSYSVTLSKEDAQNADKLVKAFESAGYQSGQLKIDNGKLTITGTEAGQKAEDLAKAGGKVSMSSTRKLTSGGLTLQIGDTSDTFNQLSVNIGDMHTKAMGTSGGKSIEDINIGTQAGAQEAVQVIKDAINYVSSIRGDLGATQNRLEHTANNLSIMAENIQDAESTIRDTDIAEEMMAYTKNNILVQSAQAMLAQANQVPQGVLQLLG